MEKFINFITNPAWWSVVVTFVAAIVAAVITYVLGRRQNELQQQQLKLQEQQNEIQKYQTKLQEQQVKAQEYEINRRLYTLIKKINLQIDKFIFTAFTYYIPDRESKDNPFIEHIDRISSLLDEFTQNFADFELKFPNEKVILKNYQFMLMEMLVIYKMFHFMLSIEKQQGQTITMDEKTSLDCLIGDDAKRVEVLLSLISHESRKVQMTNKLEGYLKNKNILLEQNLISIIANRCKID